MYKILNNTVCNVQLACSLSKALACYNYELRIPSKNDYKIFQSSKFPKNDKKDFRKNGDLLYGCSETKPVFVRVFRGKNTFPLFL